MKRLFALFMSLLSFVTALPVHGQSSAEQELKRLEAERVRREHHYGSLVEDANRLASDAEALRKKLVAAADYRDRLEREVEAKESRLIQLRHQEKDLSARIKASQSALEDVVIALLAMERDRPPTLAVQPKNVAESARVAILMGEIAPILQSRARQAASQIANLRTVRESILMQNISYRDSNTRLMIARQTIGGLIKERQIMQARILADADTERTRIIEIVRRSNDLRELVLRLGGSVPGLQATSPAEVNQEDGGFARAMGSIAYPAFGQIVVSYGATLESGGRSEGITIRTKLGAQVSAPYDGEIEFVGPFRSYGRVMILNVGGGYHLVLAGMANTYADVGQHVLAGEPIGEMTSDTRLMPDLYMEVRQQSTPLNPNLWVKRPDGT
ncbi:murein hydrolase activator EnvC family protein [Candidatus Phycosocius spiralis]|nr:peptidoglycan DD-metalloendopeptidase family protein [Candidatus Phycosocius spiralis]